jgi:amino acid transporter
MTVGWPLVTVLTLAVAASWPQLASAFPTAGALYHWASILGGRGWASSRLAQHHRPVRHHRRHRLRASPSS